MRAVPEPVGLPPGANNRAAAPLASATSITVKAKIKVRRDGIVLLFAHPDEGTSPAGVFEIEHEGERARAQISGVDQERLKHEDQIDGALKQDGAHALEH